MDKVRDSQYGQLPYVRSELAHAYGGNVHILSTPAMITLLAKVCAKGTHQPEANRIFTELYIDLLTAVVDAEFPRTQAEIPSRMIEYTERGYYAGEILDQHAKVVIAAVARAGILPSQVVFDRLNMLLDYAGVRVDHFFVQRATDAGKRVTGANVYSSKIGGPLDDAILLLPDPMGATGSSVTQTLEHYAASHKGKPKKIVTMHLIITPEYIKKLQYTYPEVIVYAIRLDRGLSAPDVLAAKPGERWEEERGLTDIHYIVPGGGGIGEVMTNSWV